MHVETLCPANEVAPQRVAGARHATPAPRNDTAAIVAELFSRLVKADLTAAGYRIALDQLARLLQQGRVTEAVTTQWVADRLDLHRNAVGAAYRDLETAGVVRRIPVRTRGAPTRTALIGPAEKLVQALRDTAAGQLRVIRAESPSSPELQAPKPPATIQPTITELTPPERARPITAAPPAVEEGDAPAVKHEPPLDPLAHLARAQRIPAVARESAMAFRGDPAALPIDPTWNLTPEDVAFVRRLVPAPEKVPRANCKPRVAAAREIAPRDIAEALWNAMPRITEATGSKRAGEILDEIAFMVLVRGLGRGDRLGGIRAGVSLVSAGRWKRPLGFDTAWYGAVLRGLQTAKESNAHETVH